MVSSWPMLAAAVYVMALVGFERPAGWKAQPHARATAQPQVPETHSDREARLADLRVKARQRMTEDLGRYTEDELRDLETLYMSTRLAGTLLRKSNARQSLERLVATYPRSNRAGCAVLELAQMSAGDEREQYLKLAIAQHGDAWFENGAQVGPLARALLAMYYAGLGRLEEAETLAAEISSLYPGSVDSAGASLDDMLPGLKLLRRES